MIGSMKFILVAFITCVLLASNANATTLKRVVISDVNSANNPALLIIKQQVTHIYNQLGISVEWVSMPTERALRFSDEGRFDAEMLRAEGVVADYQNLVQVPVPLISSDIHLYCLFPHKCDLTDKNLAIGYSVDVIQLSKICQQHQLSCTPFYGKTEVLKPLFQQKVDAFLAVDAELVNELNSIGPFLYRKKLDETLDAYHYVNKKLKDLVAPLQVELEKLAKAGKLNLSDTVKDKLNQSGRIIDL